MNFVNASLSTIGTSLVALGAISIKDDLISGVVEILIGLAVFLAYELTPSKSQ